MEETKLSRVTRSKARFVYLMCPYCSHLLKDDAITEVDEDVCMLECDNCNRVTLHYKPQIEEWKELPVA